MGGFAWPLDEPIIFKVPTLEALYELASPRVGAWGFVSIVPNGAELRYDVGFVFTPNGWEEFHSA